MLSTVYRVFQQFFGKRSTNAFPCTHAPDSIVNLLKDGEITPFVSLPEGFRGKLAYDFDKCIGCGMCLKVCPANALEAYKIIDPKKDKKANRMVFFRGKCTYCEECAVVCPVSAIVLTENFMMANYQSFGDDQIEGIEKRREFETREE